MSLRLAVRDVFLTIARDETCKQHILNEVFNTLIVSLSYFLNN